jgi:hypothetical protein
MEPVRIALRGDRITTTGGRGKGRKKATSN